MKRWSWSALWIWALLGISACGMPATDSFPGVEVRDSGEVAVTFELPEDRTLEEVLGSELGTKNTFSITTISDGSSSDGGFVYWYKVQTGGIVSQKGDICCYSPEAETSTMTGVEAPPAWVMVYSIPSDDELFNPKDVEKLSEEYGIELNLE